LLNNPAPASFKPLTATFAYYTTFITLGATMALSGPALPWLAQHTNSRLDQISAIFIASSFGYMVGSRLGGLAYDRFQGHRIQALAVLLISLSAALVPVLHSLVLGGNPIPSGNLPRFPGCRLQYPFDLDPRGKSGSFHEWLAFLLWSRFLRRSVDLR